MLSTTDDCNQVTKMSTQGQRGSWHRHTVHRIDKWAQTFKLIIVNHGVADAASMYVCSEHLRGIGWATKAEVVDFAGFRTRSLSVQELNS